MSRKWIKCKTDMVRATWAKSCPSVTYAVPVSTHQRRLFEIPSFPHRSSVDIFRLSLPIFLAHHPVAYCHFPTDSKSVPPYWVQWARELDSKITRNRGLRERRVKIVLTEYGRSDLAVEWTRLDKEHWTLKIRWDMMFDKATS